MADVPINPDEAQRRYARMLQMRHQAEPLISAEAVAAHANAAIASMRIYMSAEFPDWTEEDAGAEARQIVEQEGLQAGIAYAEELWAMFDEYWEKPGPHGSKREQFRASLERVLRKHGMTLEEFRKRLEDGPPPEPPPVP